MDLGKVEKMMQLMRSYGMHEIEIKEGDTQIKLTQSAPAPAGYLPAPIAPSFAMPPFTATSSSEPSDYRPDATNPAHDKAKKHANVIEVRSPFVGTYYSAPSPGSDEFIQVGKRVKKGDTLCIVEAMKLMNEIEAERDGVIVEILVENEEPVEYDQVLFLME